MPWITLSAQGAEMLTLLASMRPRRNAVDHRQRY